MVSARFDDRSTVKLPARSLSPTVPLMSREDPLLVRVREIRRQGRTAASRAAARGRSDRAATDRGPSDAARPSRFSSCEGTTVPSNATDVRTRARVQRELVGVSTLRSSASPWLLPSISNGSSRNVPRPPNCSVCGALAGRGVGLQRRVDVRAERADRESGPRRGRRRSRPSSASARRRLSPSKFQLAFAGRVSFEQDIRFDAAARCPATGAAATARETSGPMLGNVAIGCVCDHAALPSVTSSTCTASSSRGPRKDARSSTGRCKRLARDTMRSVRAAGSTGRRRRSGQRPSTRRAR